MLSLTDEEPSKLQNMPTVGTALLARVLYLKLLKHSEKPFMNDVKQMKLSYIAKWCEAMKNAAIVEAIFYCYICPINPSDSISGHIKVQLS